MHSFFVDHALSSRLEAAEAAQLTALVRAVSARLPELGATLRSIGGGAASFIAPNLSISSAVGLGMSGPVSDEDIEELVDFYASRGSDARVLASPFADPSLFARLGERGFRLVKLDTVLARRLTQDERLPEVSGRVAVRVAGPKEAAGWVRVSLTAFGAPGAPVPADRAAIFEAGFAATGVTYSIAEVDGAPAGTAALDLHGRTAHFFAASTLAEHRGRGVQAALILSRLAAAQRAGCDLAFTATAPGSGSQRNFERLGFSPVYSQAVLIRSADR